ncbi:uncharacterized protein EDB91DRAFT_40823 [Suillus paluster]|uniref:uncharacterized protein n=1 Tax=Suillus paluster TaxID=48578 RepID=UPI001B86FC0C|nr:uncharacterized protein EDB91DRAFT_40823 [Suillus paluster]KAG1756880.1 hypothetical protein EDB91DRAFT_40823 [Suillus paluster]
METVVDGILNLHQQLVEKKDRITQSMNMHKGFGSALWRLPTEVLSQIFDHCLPEDFISSYPSSSPTAPMLLTEVCREWREVAVGIPGLWRRLYMQVKENSDWQKVAFCYDSWLKRSRGCRLSLQLNCDADDSVKLRSLVQPYINQISSLSIFFRDPVQPELLLIDLPALQELKIWDFEHNFPSVAQCISQMPSTLRSLNVLGSWFNFEHLSSLNPVWVNLTNIVIAICQPNVFLHLLQLCPNLSSLTVRSGFNRTTTLEPFTHSEIRSIRFSLHSRDVLPLSDLFDVLSLPNLRVFEARSRSTWPHEQFKAFLLRSKCPLESLIFSGRPATLTDEERAGYIVLFPSLEVVRDSDSKSFR